MTPWEELHKKIMEEKSAALLESIHRAMDNVLMDAFGPWTDEQKLVMHLDRHPDDFDTRLILADLFEETGREGLAQVQRWLVKHKKYPCLFLKNWYWWEISYPEHRHAEIGRDIYFLEPERRNGVNRQEVEDNILRVLIRRGDIEPTVSFS